jgi:tetratricopeptide (TPR) repeat protein
MAASCARNPVQSESSLSSTQSEVVSKTSDAILLLPDMPHERTRNRELGGLVELLIQSNDLKRAEQYIGKITNWRAAQLKAHVAAAYYRNGDRKRAEKLISEVTTIAETVDGIKAGTVVGTGEYKDYLEQYDDFRLDRVKVAIAQYFWAKGEKNRSEQWSTGVQTSEQAAFIKHQGVSLAEEDYAASMVIYEILANGETFEGKKAAIDGFVQLYGLYYEEQDKRGELKALVDKFSVSMPILFRIEWLHSMAVAAYEHGDKEAAESSFSEASQLISDSALRPKLFFPIKSSNIITAHQLEMVEEAREAAELLYEEYIRIESDIFDIHRADILCNVGETFARLGRMDRAAEVYSRALEQARVNPNSRPRVEDLNLIVLSLVKNEVPLTPDLTDSMDELINGLGSPW